MIISNSMLMNATSSRYKVLTRTNIEAGAVHSPIRILRAALASYKWLFLQCVIPSHLVVHGHTWDIIQTLSHKPVQCHEPFPVGNPSRASESHTSPFVLHMSPASCCIAGKHLGLLRQHLYFSSQTLDLFLHKQISHLIGCRLCSDGCSEIFNSRRVWTRIYMH